MNRIRSRRLRPRRFRHKAVDFGNVVVVVAKRNILVALRTRLSAVAAIICMLREYVRGKVTRTELTYARLLRTVVNRELTRFKQLAAGRTRLWSMEFLVMSGLVRSVDAFSTGWAFDEVAFAVNLVHNDRLSCDLFAAA